MKCMFARSNNNIHAMKPIVTKSTWFYNDESPPIIIHKFFKMHNGFWLEGHAFPYFYFVPLELNIFQLNLELLHVKHTLFMFLVKNLTISLCFIKQCFPSNGHSLFVLHQCLGFIQLPFQFQDYFIPV